MFTLADIKQMPKKEIEVVRDKLNFNDEELRIFEMIMKDKSITEISTVTRLSARTVSRRISVIKKKVKNLQKNY